MATQYKVTHVPQSGVLGDDSPFVNMPPREESFIYACFVQKTLPYLERIQKFVMRELKCVKQSAAEWDFLKTQVSIKFSLQSLLTEMRSIRK